MPKTKKIPEINAGSMADIAFLLLVFFLVTTTIQQDAGLRVSLPQWTDEEQEAQPKNKRNVWDVVLTKSDQLFVNGSKMEIEDLRERTIEFLTNNDRNPNLSKSPRHAVISFTIDNGTSYDIYLRTNNELYASYNTIWDQMARDKHGKPWDNISEEEQKEIKKDVPRNIGEAETKFD